MSKQFQTGTFWVTSMNDVGQHISYSVDSDTHTNTDILKKKNPIYPRITKPRLKMFTLC